MSSNMTPFKVDLNNPYKAPSDPDPADRKPPTKNHGSISRNNGNIGRGYAASSVAVRDFKWMVTSFEGRITRQEYWVNSILLWLALLIPLIILGVVLALELGDDTWPIVLGISALAFIPASWGFLALQVKRWHDRNKSGWWTLIGLIPYIGGMWQFIEVGCLPGVDQGNRYGKSPLTGK